MILRVLLQGFGTLIALPQLHNGAGINVTGMLLPPGVELDKAIIPIMHWQSGSVRARARRTWC
jgi:hypothetical protein